MTNGNSSCKIQFFRCRPLIHKVLTIAAAVGVLMFVSSQNGLAQESGFRGLVTDPSGAAIVGVTITVTEENSGWTSSTVSNEVGNYELRGILPGTYTIEAKGPGFKEYVNKGVIVYANQVRRVNIAMELGPVTESITVQGEASVIETDTASITYKQSGREIYALNQAFAGWLMYTLVNNPGRETRSQVHGGYANNTRASQDGFNQMSYSKQGRPPQEVVQEINQVSLNAPAEYQHSATVAGVGKSGTNKLHGEVFANITQPRLYALPAGQTQRGASVPSYVWSYSLGGPVYIPKVYDGRNKTFFRFLIQPQAYTNTQVWDGAAMPTQKMRDGDLSEVAAVLGKPIIDPFSGLPFQDNRIPASRISPVARNVSDFIPLPNFGAPGQLTNNLSFYNDEKQTDRWQHYRIDHQISSRNTISFTHLRYYRETTHRPGEELSLNGEINRSGFDRGYSVRDTHTFTPRLINEFMFGFNHQNITDANGPFSGKELLDRFGVTDLGGRTVPDSLGSPHYFFSTVYNTKKGSLVGGSSAGINRRSDAHSTVFQDNLSYHMGRHLFKMGFQMNWQRPYYESVAGDSWGSFTYSGTFTGSDWGDFLLSLPYTTRLASPRPELLARHVELGFFFQDDWKVTPRLTLTPGIRFQHYGAPTDANGLFYNFDLDNLRVVVPDDAALSQVNPAYPKTIPIVTAAQAGWPEDLVKFKRLLVEPRIGVAWRPWGNKFVMRMGYGMYHVPYVSAAPRGGANDIMPGRTAGPFALTESFGPNQIVNGVPQITNESPFPSGPGKVGLQTVYSMPLDSRSNNWPYDQQWNVTLERELPWRSSIRMSYVGSKGTHWPYTRNLQIPRASTIKFTPDRRPYGPDVYSAIYVNELGGNSVYHGLELELGRQFSQGLYLRGWYEWKKALNDVQGGLFGSATGLGIEDQYNRTREKGYQDGFQPHTGRIVAVYELPFGRGKKFRSGATGVLNHLIGGWTITPHFTFYKGQRYTPTFSGVDTANIGVSSGRPDQLCSPNEFGSAPGVLWNKSCFAIPSNGNFGSASRGMLFGPTVWTLDFNVFKTWNLLGREGGPYFKVEWYTMNLFNHANARNPDSTNIASAGFGLFRPFTYDYRTMYFRLRVGF